MKEPSVRLAGDKMQTLSQCMNSLKEHGFNEEFIVTEKGLTSKDDQKSYRPDEIQIVDFYRFEGESSPSDSAILYAIETNDGSKGVLVDAYGVYADDIVTKFIGAVEEIQKKNSGAQTIKNEDKSA